MQKNVLKRRKKIDNFRQIQFLILFWFQSLDNVRFKTSLMPSIDGDQRLKIGHSKKIISFILCS